MRYWIICVPNDNHNSSSYKWYSWLIILLTFISIDTSAFLIWRPYSNSDKKWKRIRYTILHIVIHNSYSLNMRVWYTKICTYLVRQCFRLPCTSSSTIERGYVCLTNSWLRVRVPTMLIQTDYNGSCFLVSNIKSCYANIWVGSGDKIVVGKRD